MGRESRTRTGAVTRSVRLRSDHSRALGSALSRSLESPAGVWGVLATMAATLIAMVVVIWTSEMPLVSVGRVMTQTRQVRVPMETRDREGETEQREAARNRTPRVFVANADVIEELRGSIEALPRVLASVSAVEQIDAGIQAKFSLTHESLAAFRAMTDRDRAAWGDSTTKLVANLHRRPVLDRMAVQRALTEGSSPELRLVLPDESSAHVSKSDVVDLGDEQRRTRAMRSAVREAGFVGVAADVVVNRLVQENKPTFRPDEAATSRDMARAGGEIEPVFVRHPRGHVIFSRGDVLTPPQADLYRNELEAHLRLSTGAERWAPRTGLAAASITVATALAGYVALFVPRIRRSPGRIISAAGLACLGLAAACLATVAYPGLVALTLTVPVLLVAMLLTVAYEQRVALAFGVLLATLACIATHQSMAVYAVVVTGVASAAWQLRDVRDRSSMVRGAIVTGIALALGMFVWSLVEKPVPVALGEIAFDAGLAGCGAVLCGGVVLFLLPTVERAFDVATPLTLVEMSNLKQPLLRELQRRAPGTYNHSLNVAAIAEAAADSINANSLLTYVGSLYHDIGKMNKPEYFIENRSGGLSKHDKLSPALSLLVIVGHVKDGMELAEEFGLPRSIRHFVEAHHGTTLVEYFYHRAKTRAMAAAEEAEVDDDVEPSPQVPDEVEYRYPGPKPQTKEAAILMVSDAVESAARTLSDPTPARIEALVRELAHKRLMDGQFDDCELTLRELSLVCESISRTVTSIYHGRVAYPGERRA